MTRWLAAAKLATDATTQPTELTKPTPRPNNRDAASKSTGVLSVMSVVSEDEAGKATHDGGLDDSKTEAFPHGVTASGRPLTWTGRVVSISEWRQLSSWDRNGPDGRVWNGKTRRWEEAEKC